MMQQSRRPYAPIGTEHIRDNSPDFTVKKFRYNHAVIQAVLLAFALAMDATAVALARGLAGRRVEMLALPLLFGVFQAAMAWGGLLLGGATEKYVGAWKLWIAATILVGLGARMTFTAWRRSSSNNDAESEQTRGHPRWTELITLAVATSIDAAVAGATLQSFAVKPATAIALIGVITLLCCAAGFAGGLWLRSQAKRKRTSLLDLAGGLILVGLGIKVVLDAVTTRGW
jgi:manganese efflux pump family protein